MLADEINAVDWLAIPTPRLHVPRVGRDVPEWFDLRSPAPGLRDLATATNIPAVAEAATYLTSSSILWGHMGAVFPAAVTAAPFLLRIVERDYVHARDAALSLLSNMLDSAPFEGFNRVGAADGSTPALCCAVAELIRARQDHLLPLGKPGRLLLEECSPHWRFEITEVARDGADLIVLGHLGGRIPASGVAGELQRDGMIVRLDLVAPEYLLDGVSGEACLRIERAADELQCVPGAVMFPAECGDYVH
ncbi:hypothetical protein ACF09I_32620 [Streptomyces sp. NPDC014940]|uniref:hypothetical protein n=1 Tax=Streptomyces sp. NPDC014940 TaxID=3364932 RepID=UPI0036F5F018